MLKRGIVGTVAAAIGLEVYNRRVAHAGKRLENQLPAEPQMWRWRFGEVAVYSAGDPQNPPLLLLHGHNAAASAAEMREPFARLSEHYHVYAPDLPGYGLSARPDISYDPQLYVAFIEDILREVVQRPANVITSSLTSAYAIEAAASSPEWIKTLVLICPAGVRSLAVQPRAGKAVEAILGLPLLGQALYNAIASRPSIAYFLREQTYHDRRLVTDEVVERYYRTSHAAGARYAPSAFVSGKLYLNASEAWTRLEQPILIFWGRQAKLAPISNAAAFLATNPAAQLEEIDRAGILPHDEQPAQFSSLVHAWLSRPEEGAAE